MLGLIWQVHLISVGTQIVEEDFEWKLVTTPSKLFFLTFYVSRFYATSKRRSYQIFWRFVGIIIEVGVQQWQLQLTMIALTNARSSCSSLRRATTGYSKLPIKYRRCFQPNFPIHTDSYKRWKTLFQRYSVASCKSIQFGIPVSNIAHNMRILQRIQGLMKTKHIHKYYEGCKWMSHVINPLK
jgi:hypothetical protein